ncbi:Ras family [Musa troglodytarum]|uniref:Ras family n=1 Tax=Musa troglodytarum TaxID=320322 RepID=A0A9E7K7D2_9LILI|nr:Ras family [Musa troglodytarum]
MCFGPPDLAFVFDLPGYGFLASSVVGKIRNLLWNPSWFKRFLGVRFEIGVDIGVIHGMYGPPFCGFFCVTLAIELRQVGKMAVMLRNVYDVICEKQAAMVRTSHLTKSLIIGEWDSHKKTSTKGLSPAPPRKGTRVLDDEPEKEPPRKSVVCSLRNEIMNYVFWCLAGFKGYPLLAKLNVPPTAGSRD